MNTLDTKPTIKNDIEASIQDALLRIPPLWPLKHFVAVNPFLGLASYPFKEACELLQRTTGAAPLQKPHEYIVAYESGVITVDDLQEAGGDDYTVNELIHGLLAQGDEVEVKQIATVADLLDAKLQHAHWGEFVTDEISKWCAIAFDENQTTWRSPWKTHGLYASWLEAAVHDLNPEAFGLEGFRAFVAKLPKDTSESIAYSIDFLDVKPVDLTDFLHRELATISGWAGYVQYLVREDTMRGKENAMLQDLLAIRLAYDAALYQFFSVKRRFRKDWESQVAPENDKNFLAILICWQRAYELGYQKKLAKELVAQPSAQQKSRPKFQAIFCIDVRSEVFRRHLEAAEPQSQTIGFAGFFGFPVAHRPLGADHAATRCPVLLVPPVETGEPVSAAMLSSAQSRRAEAGAWKAFQNSATSCFSFVEAAGIAFGLALMGKRKGAEAICQTDLPAFQGGDLAAVETRAAMAEGALRNMSLTKNFARLVLVCGHGSQSANNPYASGLDCGACGGHAGDVNARLAATALNDPAIRAILEKNGILIPDDTYFLAGLHNTTTDAVQLFDTEKIPTHHAGDLAALRSALTVAGATALMERAPSLGLGSLPMPSLRASLAARVADASQVRPEWGLANNAAIIAAPRSRTAGLKLVGRSFLHDYDASADPENKVLTLILCAPVVVASWINLQYYASRVDQQRYGSGNKTLHNVAAGLGVFEGNGGDIRTGLPLQSIHDGERFIHEPRRLSVFIEAERQNIDSVLTAQAGVKELFDNEWIYLCALEGAACYRYSSDGWKLVA